MALKEGTVLVGHYKFVPERSEFIGAVASQEGKVMTVLSIGCEDSEFAILNWIKETIRLMREAGRLDVQAPDMYDRARTLADLN